MPPQLVLLNFETLGHFKTSSLDVAAQSPDSTVRLGATGVLCPLGSSALLLQV